MCNQLCAFKEEKRKFEKEFGLSIISGKAEPGMCDVSLRDQKKCDAVTLHVFPASFSHH